MRLLCSDSHCHVKLATSRGTLAQFISHATPHRSSSRQLEPTLTGISDTHDGNAAGRVTSMLSVRHLVVCGVHPAVDWDIIERLAKQHSSATATTIAGAAAVDGLPQTKLCPCHADNRRRDHAVQNRESMTCSAPSCSDGVGVREQHDEDMASSLASLSSHWTCSNVRVCIGFGVHPWYVSDLRARAAKDTDEEMPESTARDREGAAARSDSVATKRPPASLASLLSQLEDCLRRYPHAIVGEIGLDKVRGPSEAAQSAAFVAQMRLAAKYHRPVSVHCVRHYGLLLKLLNELPAEATPPSIILHAFTGSTEVAMSLLRMKPKKMTPAAQTALPTDHMNTSLSDTSTNNDSHGTYNVDSAMERAENTRARAALAGQDGAHAMTRAPNARSRADEVVKIKERIYFGVGLATSYSVKNFAQHTLPRLLAAHRVLMETDAHYAYIDYTSRNPNSTDARLDEGFLACPYGSATTSLLQLTQRTLDESVALKEQLGISDEKELVHHIEENFARAFATVLDSSTDAPRHAICLLT